MIYSIFSHLRAPRESRDLREFQDPKACQASKEIRCLRRLENTREKGLSLGCCGTWGWVRPEETELEELPGEDISLHHSLFFQGFPGKTGPRGGVVSPSVPRSARRH